ncbi:MAG: thioredoxin-disulfide reductase [Candidatus Melainabacteria bacterium]|nr:thioredoxin-disulfide reductase [Candidatus Melainabacteria bacterium]
MATRKRVTILGSGPAGYTAAIYAAMAGLEPLLIHGPSTGGQLMLTTTVENFPGFANGIMGPDLMEETRKQAERLGTEFLQDLAESVDLSAQPFLVKTASQEILTDSLIIATGASAKQLGLASEKSLIGRGVSYCATCDGFFFKDKIVYVVGGGDSAMEEATVLAARAKTVTIIHRGDSFKASQRMIDKAKREPKISFSLNSVVEDILDAGKGEVTGIKVKDLKTGDVQELPADGVFIAIGHQPNTELFKEQLELTESGYIMTDGVKTSVAGVFAAGDVMDERYKQAIVAAGNGSSAALEARWFLSEKDAESSAS